MAEASAKIRCGIVVFTDLGFQTQQHLMTLVEHMLVRAGTTTGIHAFVTHDSLVTATAAQMLSKELAPDAWPDFLEAAFFWKQGNRIGVGYGYFGS